MATEYINNFITELIATYGIESLSELETMAISAINKEKYLKKTLQPFFISDEFKEEYPYDYSKLESLCKNIKILNYIDKSNYNTGLEYFILSLPGCVQDLSVGLMKTSWTRHGLEVRERTYYINYRYEPYDKGYNYIITETDFDTHTDEVNNENFIEKIINQVYGYFSNVEKETEFKIYFFALLTSVLLTNSDNEYNSQWYSDVKIMCEEMEEWIKLE